MDLAAACSVTHKHDIVEKTFSCFFLSIFLLFFESDLRVDAAVLRMNFQTWWKCFVALMVPIYTSEYDNISINDILDVYIGENRRVWSEVACSILTLFCLQKLSPSVHM